MKDALPKPLQRVVTVAACLSLAACDQTGPATVRQEAAAPATSKQAAPLVAAPPTAPVAPTKPTSAPSTPAQKPIEPARQAPTPELPVTVTMRADKSTLHGGESFTVTVDVQIASGWHIYAVDRPTGLSVPTKIKLQLPARLESVGDWKAPEPALDDSSAGEPAFVYHDAAVFQQTLRVKPGTAAGPIVIPAEFRYQVCDRFSCRAPATLKLQTSIQIAP
jgi:DsbC/DsbD-like thiol-disulfide interchange protein